MTYGEFFKKYNAPEWRARVEAWVQAYLLKLYEGQDPKAVERFKQDYAQQKTKYPDIALRLFWKEFAATKLKKNPDFDLEEVLDPSTPIEDEDILDDHPGVLEVLQQWQAARSTAEAIKAIRNVVVKDLRAFDPRHLESGGSAKALPPEFLEALVDYGSPEVSRLAKRFLADAPTGKDLTMRVPQAIKLLESKGIPLENMSHTGTKLLDIFMNGHETMWELDFSTKKARIGTVDRAGKFTSMKQFNLSDGFIHQLADFWKKNQ